MEHYIFEVRALCCVPLRVVGSPNSPWSVLLVLQLERSIFFITVSQSGDLQATICLVGWTRTSINM